MPVTPPPWRSSNNSVWSHTLKENSEHGNTICVGTQNNFSDMDHIVKCVNMHEHLITELEKIKVLAWEHYDPTHKKEASSAELALNLGMIAGIVSNLLIKANEAP